MPPVQTRLQSLIEDNGLSGAFREAGDADYWLLNFQIMDYLCCIILKMTDYCCSLSLKYIFFTKLGYDLPLRNTLEFKTLHPALRP